MSTMIEERSRKRGTLVRHATALAFLGLLPGCVSIYPKASATLDCPEDQIEFTGSIPVRSVQGCGRADYLYFDGSAWSSLRERAAFDMKCDSKALKITVLDGSTFGVDGCESRVTYKFVNGTGFVMNVSQGHS